MFYLLPSGTGTCSVHRADAGHVKPRVEMVLCDFQFGLCQVL